MKRIFAIVLALTLCLGLVVPAAAASDGRDVLAPAAAAMPSGRELAPEAASASDGQALADWTYKLDNDTRTVILTKYIGTGKAVTVPDSFRLGGRTYDTVLYTNTAFRANTNITSVTIGAGVRFYNNSMRLLFGECTALTSVDLTAVDTTGVTDMSYIFYHSTALKAADLSAFDTSQVVTMRAMFCYCIRMAGLTGYEHWDTGALEDMNHMFDRFAYSVSASTPVTVDLSGWDLDQVKNNGWCFQNCRAQTILLPDNLGLISAGFLNHATRYAGTTFTVPAGVKKVGYAHTIYDFATNDFVEFRVAEGNTAYQAIDGILYSADGKEMLAVPRNKPFEDGVYEIPEGVNFLGELSFSRNYNIHTLVLPDSYELEYVGVYDPRYIVFEDTGNLNAGSNLSIAIYCYTGITHYAVKDTNPRYASANGVIYSKDWTHVVAVPARYDEPLVIPEGATHWDREAMWADGSSTVDNLFANCSGVSIPASMTWISEDQLAMLNRLHTNRAAGDNPFAITLAAGNTAFTLDGDGCLRRVLTITEQPQDWTGALGDFPQVRVTAQGEGLTYQWYYRDADAQGFRKSSETDDCYDSYPLSVERDGREMYCVVTDEYGNSVQSQTAFMRLDPAAQAAPLAITEQPQDWAGALGEYPSVRVEAQGEGLMYQWYCRDAGRSDFYASSETDDTYDSYPMAPERDGREIYCMVTDAWGRTVKSASAFLRLAVPEEAEPLTIPEQPQDWSGELGEYPSVRVVAQGEGLTYRWYCRDAGKSYFYLSSETDDTYDSYPMAPERDGREIYCVITDQYGRSVTSRHAFLRLTAPAEAAPLTITAEPEDWFGYLGEYPSVRVVAEGEGLTYCWYYRDAGASGFKKSSDTDAAYDSYPLEASRAGRQLYCVVTDVYGRQVKSRIAVMDFVAAPEGYEGPVITEQPQTWLGAAGEYPVIRVTAEGEGLIYRWYYRDAGETDYRESSETDDCYDSYPMNEMRDGRQVYCVVTDRYGRSVKSSAAFMYATE